MNDAFKVWLRPLGASCRVRVEGLENGNWLLARLRQSFVFKTVEPSNEVEGSTFRNFRVDYNPSLSHSTLEATLASIPSVRLMTEPE